MPLNDMYLGGSHPNVGAKALLALLVALSTVLVGQSPAWGQLVFRDVTGERVSQASLDLPRAEKEVELGDFDRDGDLDAVISIAGAFIGARRNRLYRNDGGTLVEVTGSPLIAGFESPDVSRASFLRDYDGDGWLDLVVVNDSIARGRAGETVYFAARHEDGVFTHFEDQSERLGGAGGPSCGAVSVDLDGDGDFDLYIGNYPVPAQDTLYLNDGDGRFNDVTELSVPVDGDYTSDVSAADLDGDGLIDILVGNHFDDNVAYLNGGLSGAQPGRLTGGVLSLSPGPALPGAMEPGDFDGDGRVDVYVSNHTGTIDRVLQNRGPDADGRPRFKQVEVPASVTRQQTRKATVADLDGDGRPEVVVMTDQSRPTLLRNTSTGGTISFVDWTPGSSFPAGLEYAGWHAAVFDADADGRPDLLLGGSSRDHLLLQTDLTPTDAMDLGGVLPELFNRDPVAIEGRLGEGEEARFLAADVAIGSQLTLVAGGCGDLSLEVLDGSGDPVVVVDRGGRGVEEAIELRAPGGDLQIVLRGLAGCTAGGTGAADYLLEVLNRDAPCDRGRSVLCLDDDRFRVAVSWQADGRSGAATATRWSTETGYFTFFDPANVEVVVKVLDGRGVNGAHWVFFASLSNVEFEVEVTDTLSGVTRRYLNPAGDFASVADVEAFPVGSERPSPRLPDPGPSAPASAVAPCPGEPSALCFADGRFSVAVEWQDFADVRGVGRGVPLTGDSAGFWFFSSSNLDFVVKVLDARPVNGYYWVFFGGLTNVASTLTVTDNLSGEIRIYTTALGELASRGDVAAFLD